MPTPSCRQYEVWPAAMCPISWPMTKRSASGRGPPPTSNRSLYDDVAPEPVSGGEGVECAVAVDHVGVGDVLESNRAAASTTHPVGLGELRGRQLDTVDPRRGVGDTAAGTRNSGNARIDRNSALSRPRATTRITIRFPMMVRPMRMTSIGFSQGVGVAGRRIRQAATSARRAEAGAARGRSGGDPGYGGIGEDRPGPFLVQTRLQTIVAPCVSTWVPTMPASN